jgi:hypothetical protein
MLKSAAIECVEKLFAVVVLIWAACVILGVL